MRYPWLFALMIVILGCSEIEPGSCYPNTSGGAGGGGTMPIGAGVGATTTTGTYGADPPKGPLDTGNGGGDTYSYCIEDNPCMSRCPTGGGVNGFSPGAFKFVTTIPDDGTGTPGGWQKASVSLKFRRWVGLLPEVWTCPQITIGMPLQNAAQGKISADMAASISAEVATQVSGAVMTDDIPPGIFCFKFKEEMRSRIGKAVKGATLSSP
jgi:hypothetical protein